jgi:hypothetical protein
MGVCRFCREEIREKDKICLNCGYNPQTDTVTPNFIKREKKEITGKKKSLISPGVKNFVFLGSAVIILSLLFKYQANLGDVIYQVRSFIVGNKNKVNKPVDKKQSSGKDNGVKVTGLLGVRSFKAPVDKSQLKDKKIEGIFYDPKNTSYVVINGQLVSEGKSVGNMLIKKINQDSVEVVEEGSVKILR